MCVCVPESVYIIFMHIYILFFFTWVLFITTGKRLRNFAADKGKFYLSNAQQLMSFLEKLYFVHGSVMELKENLFHDTQCGSFQEEGN